MAVFEFRTELPCSVSELFNFLIRPKNIALVSDPSLGLIFVDPPEVLTLNEEIDFKIVSFGQVHRITHKIIEISENSQLVEEQTSGPMKLWRHTHKYESTDNGCVKLDIVEFAPPGGLVGFFLTEDKVSDHLEDGFCYREEKLQQLISQGELR